MLETVSSGPVSIAPDRAGDAWPDDMSDSYRTAYEQGRRWPAGKH